MRMPFSSAHNAESICFMTKMPYFNVLRQFGVVLHNCNKYATKMHASQRARNRDREGESQKERADERERSIQRARESAGESHREPETARESYRDSHKAHKALAWLTRPLLGSSCLLCAIQIIQDATPFLAPNELYT